MSYVLIIGMIVTVRFTAPDVQDARNICQLEANKIVLAYRLHAKCVLQQDL